MSIEDDSIPEEIGASKVVQDLIREYQEAQNAALRAKLKLQRTVKYLKEALVQAEIDRQGSTDSGYNESGRWLV
jgi:hypothetical protein